MMEDFLIIVCLIALFIGCCVGVIATSNLPEKSLCEMIDTEHLWTPWIGCKVKTDGGNWVSYDQAWMLEVDPTLIKDIQR